MVDVVLKFHNMYLDTTKKSVLVALRNIFGNLKTHIGFGQAILINSAMK
jgi:hypothetical protein